MKPPSLWDALIEHWRYFGLQSRIGYRFKSISLLNQALTHPSRHHVNNQRLEFLGDAVLELLVSEYMYREYPEVNEGTLTQLKIMSVNNMHLMSVAINLRLEEFLMLGASLKPRDGVNDKLYADAIEALIGAIYMDGGLRSARRFVNRFVIQTLPTLEETKTHPKTALQNWAKKQGFDYPEYDVILSPETQGKSDWTVKCTIRQLAITRSATAKNRKLAEREVAETVLRDLGVYNNGV